MSRPSWHPRGDASYPRPWRVGDRVRVKRTGATGTVSYVVPPGVRVGYGVRVKWDNGYEGPVVAAAFDLERIPV